MDTEKTDANTNTNVKDAEVVTEEQSQETHTAESGAPASAPETEKTNSGMTIWYVLIALAILGGAAYLGYQQGWFGMSSDAPQAAQEAIFEPVSGTVARVNGVEIDSKAYNDRLNQIAGTVAAQGINVANEEAKADVQKQALDSLISTQLLLQAAESEGITVSAAEVDAEYQALIERFGGEEQFMTRVDEVGLTVDQVRSDLESELLISGFLSGELTPEDTAVSDAEIEARYDELTTGMENPPALEEVRAQIEQPLVSEKQQAVLMDIIDELTEAADIEILLE